MALLIEELDISMKLSKKDEFHSGFSAVNNACWSCGEIALQQGAGMSPYVSRLYERLLNIIQTPNISSSLTENAAIALGRIGIGSYEELAPHLDSFAYPFLDALADVAETDEKDTALRGFSMVVSRNPEAMESCLVPYFTMIATYEEPGDELMELFRQVSTYSILFCSGAFLT
jgi:transportin-1